MTVTLGAVITAARDRHPAFHRTRVTDAVFARFLSDWQNELIGRAVARDAGFLAQSVGIAISLSSTNAPGTVGAGTSGGLPGDLVDDELSVAQETAGALIFPLTSVAAGGVIIVAERVATAAAAASISSTGAGRTTDQDVGCLVHITGGKGLGQVREVLSNTAAQWVISTGSDGKQWTTTPDTTSLFTIIAPSVGADETLGVVTALPAESTRAGYLVRLSAQGVPYVDYTQPLSVTLDRGVPLPSMLTPIGGTLRFTDQAAEPLAITSYARRFDCAPAVYELSGSLYLCGSADDWTGVASIELRYVPIAPVFTALTDLFLIPDAARPAAIAAAVAFAAARVDGVDGISLDVGGFETRAIDARTAYLKTLRLKKRTRSSIFRDGFPE